MINILEKNIEKAVELLKNAKHVTAFTGAGISVESGIPAFRGENGLWNKYDSKLLEFSSYKKTPERSWPIIREIFYDFFGKANPNSAHKILAKMEKAGVIKTIITQNIDNLHQSAGSVNVIEFHGTSKTFVCLSCNSKFDSGTLSLQNTPPKCSKCGGLLKPDFIFFGEGIPEEAFKKSFEEAKIADVFLIIGTTGEVMPASMIPKEAKMNGVKIIEINPEKSQYTEHYTNIFLKGKACAIMERLDKLM